MRFYTKSNWHFLIQQTKQFKLMYNTYIQVSRFAIKMLLEKFVATNWSIYFMGNQQILGSTTPVQPRDMWLHGAWGQTLGPNFVSP